MEHIVNRCTLILFVIIKQRSVWAKKYAVWGWIAPLGSRPPLMLGTQIQIPVGALLGSHQCMNERERDYQL